MLRYHASFHGRTRGAIGIFHPIDTFVSAEDIGAARLALYERFEHIQALRLTPLVQRYVVTYTPEDGRRTLAHAMQGQHTYATAAEAQAWIDAALAPGTNSADTLRSVFGPDPRFETRPAWCWPGHFDPTSRYFEDGAP